MFVGGEKAHLVRNGFVDERFEGRRIGAADHAGDDVALALDGSDDDELVSDLTADATGFLVPNGGSFPCRR
jgi:hypothetical protein